MLRTRSGRPRRLTRTAGRLAAAVALTVTTLSASVLTGSMAPAAADSLDAVRTIGGSGHAGLYGWGVATAPDGTVLIGDYWNFRIARYTPDGTHVGDVVTAANKGSANNEEPAPELHQSPYGIAVDPSNGDVFFGDVDGGKTVDKYAADGTFLMSFGGNGTGPGKFRYPSRMAVGPNGHLYVADQWDHVISVHDTDNGAELFAFGANGGAPGQFRQPRGLAFDATGRLFVIDNYNARVQVFDQDGTFQFQFGSEGSNPGQFGNNPDLRGLAIDKTNGWVYVVDASTGWVNKYDLTGRYLDRFGGFGGQPANLKGGGREVAVDADGNVWVGDMPGFRAIKYDSDGNFLRQVPSPAQPPAPGGFNQPRGVALDASGNVFVTDTHNWRVQKFAPDGTFVTQWGHRGGGRYGFNYQRGIAVDRRDGSVVVADTDNHKIKKYTNDGDFLWEVGAFGANLGQFKNPHGVHVGPDGKIYVADTQNQRVQVLDENGGPLRAFGSKGNGNGQFQFNRSVTVDPLDGTIWVSDSVRGVVQHFTATGAYLSKFGTLGDADHQLRRAADVEVDADRVYVADVDNHKIKMWAKDGTFLGATGGGGTSLGQMFNPHGMDIAPDGTLYVAEQTGERVQQFRALGAVPDAENPTMTVASPATNQVMTGPDVTFRGSAADDVGIGRVDVAIKDVGTGLWWNGAGWGSHRWLPTALTNPDAPTTDWTFAWSPAPSGSYAVQTRAMDLVGNSSTKPWVPFSVTHQADVANPTVSITSPRKDQVLSDPAVTMTGAASDDTGVGRVDVAIKNVNTGQWWTGSGWGSFTWLRTTLSSPNATDTNWSFSWTAPANGSYGIQVRSVDLVGKASPQRWVPFSVTS